MKCPHAETTTLLWIYGEGPEGHEAHVANCADCQAVLAMHEDVQFHVAAIEDRVQMPVNTAPPEIPEPANRGWMGTVFGVGGLALAAAAVLFAWIGFPGVEVPSIETVPEAVVERAQTQDDGPKANEVQTPEDSKSEPQKLAQVAAAKVYWDFDGIGDDWEDPFDALEADFEVLEEGMSTL